MANASFNPLAVIAGCAVDYGGTYAALYAFALARLLVQGPPTEAASPAMTLTSVALGALCTVLGGFTAARFARANPLAHGAAVGVVATLLGVLSLMGSSSASVERITLIGIGISLPAGVVGSLIGGTRD